jgi:hypothetical protein
MTMQSAPKSTEFATDLQHIVCRTNHVVLSDFTEARREPTRPVEFRPDNFERQFDSTTLFYDAVEIGDRQVVLFAPPFFNLTDALSNTCFFQGSEPREPEIRHLDRHAQIWLKASPDGGIRAVGPLGDVALAVSPNRLDMFRDRRVIFTMSKDNPIEWIVDWVKFNRDVHGADAVLIYDNASTAYSSAALSAALRAVPGIERSVVVEWPFKYGPQGANSRQHWDSDFCQLGAWEHARWCFLRQARSVMNADIDELVLSQSGQSAFEAAEQSHSGFVRYRGRWIIGVDDGRVSETAERLPRHRDFNVLMPPNTQFSWPRGRRDSNVCAPKWTVVPAKCPRRAQWLVHSISPWLPSYLPCSRNFSFGHFREIGSNWKYQRTSRVPFDPSIHRANALLQTTFQRVNWLK